MFKKDSVALEMRGCVALLEMTEVGHQHTEEGWPPGSVNLISLWLGPVQKDGGCP
jgi:hypothetical protein